MKYENLCQYLSNIIIDVKFHRIFTKIIDCMANILYNNTI